MLILQKEKYPSVKSLLNEGGYDIFPLVNSVISGKQEGKIFADSENDASCVFVLHHAGFSQVFFLQENFNKNHFYDFISYSDVIPYYFHFYNSVSNEIHEMERRGLVVKIRERRQFRFLDLKAVDIDLIGNFQIKRTEELDFKKLEVFNLDLGKRFWNSEFDFKKEAYGVCVVDEQGLPVSICYSACIADNISEIDVMTLEKYRGMGFGRVVTLAYINESIKRNIYPNWDCFTENISSLRTAVSAGFTPLKKYGFVSVYNKLKHEKTGGTSISPS